MREWKRQVVDYGDREVVSASEGMAKAVKLHGGCQAILKLYRGRKSIERGIV
jgi:hypothetical protein